VAPWVWDSIPDAIVEASILEPSLVFLTGTFKTKGGKELRRVKATSDVLRSGQENQRRGNDPSARLYHRISCFVAELVQNWGQTLIIAL